MSGYDNNEDRVFFGAFALVAVLGAIGLVVLLSGHGIVNDPSAPPASVTTTIGDTSPSR
ncbi:hypothetical protein KGQ20_04060 [Catenulispora sp. NF23]|uniref:Uncharacterized protein n=1 Tax=Catenulispora pinistramenti TaxID=2705254 RepID=A0ABS5KJR9_9ACTN|nr:hypothetical protein [Catenulispora pinistramenti]MBS2531938.1 hypothetical protein [Catenulispora pinistramenti]MBS2546205.1 hypothetical protein [Catenulispora pinistramenti]